MVCYHYLAKAGLMDVADLKSLFLCFLSYVGLSQTYKNEWLTFTIRHINMLRMSVKQIDVVMKLKICLA